MQSSPDQSRALLALQIVDSIILPPKPRQDLQRPRSSPVTAKLGGKEPLYPRLGSGGDKVFLGCSGRGCWDDGILALEGFNELILGVGFGDGVYLDVGREGGFGRLAGEYGDGEVWVCVEGGEDGRSNITAGLKDG
jgi:hypothetical protein